MRETRLHSILRRALPMLACLLLCSCLKVPLGDPEKSKVEQRYAGAWLWENPEARHLIVLQSWDARTYYVRMIALSDDVGKRKAEMTVMKGWLTRVGAETFLTLQDAESLSSLPGEDEEKIYAVMKLNQLDDRLIATPLNASFPPFEVVRSPEELHQMIEQHMDNPAMWAEDPIEAVRASPEQRKAFEDAYENALAVNESPSKGGRR